TCLLMTGVLACDQAHSVTNVDQTPVQESQLQFLRFSSSNAVTVRSASFWAVKGQNRKLIMRYTPSSPGQQGDTFHEREARNNSLPPRGGGLPMLPGDYILITVALDNSDRFIVHFEPSGLLFNPLDPPRLEINYERADRDIDHDGDVDAHDHALDLALGVW